MTVTRDGLTYHQDTNKPVTGIVEEFHENGQLMGRGNFIDGKREGLKEVFYRNGQLQYRGNHIDGEIDGLSESFHENGQLRWRTRTQKNQTEDGEKSLHGVEFTPVWSGVQTPSETSSCYLVGLSTC